MTALAQTVHTLARDCGAIRIPSGEPVTLAAGKLMGRAMKLRLEGNGGGNGASKAAPPPSNGPGARSRPAEDPVVKRMQEKFGAQIRTVIDYRDKR